MSTRNSLNGSQTITNHLYTAEIQLPPLNGATQITVVLPTNSHLHIFAIATK
ncbi:MAG TPA: hypothetical protein VL461_03850 [Dictyobacter sp.]|nr:hypothetical protein [Dictyobacter sp.]